LLIALVYLVYVIAASINSIQQTPSDLVVEPIRQGVETAKQEAMDMTAIKDWHLFGQPPEQTLPGQGLASGDNAIPQETKLQLKLLGVFFLPGQGNKKSSYAIIEAEDHVQKRYQSGDELPGSATLESIAQEQVILRHNQQNELLSMDRKKGILLKTQ
jgi:type II secretory pathway component PulC